MKLFFVRHGESADNRDGVIQGWTNSELSELGREQAAEIAARLGAKNIDLIISSDLTRARETAEIIGAKLGREILADWRVRERFYGDLQGQPKSSDPDKIRHNLLMENPPFNIEPPAKMCERLKSFAGSLNYFRGQYNSVTIISHGCIINALRHNLDPKFVWEKIANGEIVEMDLDEIMEKLEVKK